MKQALIDILIVLALPALVLIIYLAVNSGTAQNVLYSITGNTQSATGDLGARTTQALNELERIKLDSSIFTWKEFNDMKFTQTQIKIDPIGKKNPFLAD